MVATINGAAALRIELRQGSDEWLAWRDGGIGSSDAPPIMGVSPWLTAVEQWEEFTGRRPRRSVNAAMRRGSELEPVAREQFERLTGGRFAPACLQSVEREWMRASLDGLSPDGAEVLEIKCPTDRRDFLAVCEGLLPLKYEPQVCHQLEVSKADVVHFAVRDPETGELRWVDVGPDADYAATLIAAEQAFLDAVLTDTRPPLTEADALLREDAAWLELAREYREVATAEKQDKARKEELRAKLIALKSHTRERGGGVLVTTFDKQGEINKDGVIESLAARVRELGGDLDLHRLMEAYRLNGKAETRITVEKVGEVLW